MNRGALARRVHGDPPAAAWDRWAASARGRAWLAEDADDEPNLLPSLVDGVWHLHCYGLIGDPPWGYAPQDFVVALREAGGAPVVLHLDSPGGVATSGLTIRQLLLDYDGATTARIEGLCASAATMVAAGCDERVMTPGTQWMIHESTRLAIVTASTIDAVKSHLVKMDAAYAEEYARIGRGDSAHYLTAMRAETWFDVDGAVAEGFAIKARLTNAAMANHDTARRARGSAVTEEEKAQLAAAQAAAEAAENAKAAAEKRAAEAEARLAASQPAPSTDAAILESAQAVAKAEARATEAERQLKELQAKAADAEMETKLAKYPADYRAVARIAIESDNKDALAKLDALSDMAAQSTQSRSDPEAEDPEPAAEKPADDPNWQKYQGMVADTARAQGVSRQQAEALVRNSPAGREVLQEMANARLRSTIPADHRRDFGV